MPRFLEKPLGHSYFPKGITPTAKSWVKTQANNVFYREHEKVSLFSLISDPGMQVGRPEGIIGCLSWLRVATSLGFRVNKEVIRWHVPLRGPFSSFGTTEIVDGRHRRVRRSRHKVTGLQGICALQHFSVFFYFYSALGH